MKIEKVIKGTHNKVQFQYENGILCMFGKYWDLDDIQTLIETANLLKIEGYNIKKPKGVRKEKYISFLGGEHEEEVKEYDE